MRPWCVALFCLPQAAAYDVERLKPQQCKRREVDIRSIVLDGYAMRAQQTAEKLVESDVPEFFRIVEQPDDDNA